MLRGFALAVAFAVHGASSAAPVHLDLAVSVDPATRELRGHGVVTTTLDGPVEIVLARRFEAEPAATLARGELNVWRLPEGPGERRLEIRWRGTLDPLDASLTHRETLGGTPPVSGPDGMFLPSGAAWYPGVAGARASYRFALELPQGQKGLVPGRLVEESEADGRYRATFDFREPAEGIDLMAGPYRVDTRLMRGPGGGTIALRTYFHPQIADLAPGYLDAVRDYLALYEHWIGAYPFSEFSVVSSPTPTGFGMPTLTYLGVDVLRLPFIRQSSLGHEVLHNWWGNGVYPDYARGNWSEGLTTFMADYAYREREGPAAARAMRLEWLRDFAAVPPGQDHPLASFVSRTHGTSQIVGYNKAAMVFFMLRDLIGVDAFDRGVQEFWRAERFRTASWSDLARAFEGASVRELGPFFAQWLTRSGAPSLAIERAAAARTATGYLVTATLAQRAPAYALRVPVLIRTESGDETRVVELDRERRVVALEVTARPTAVVLDPDFRLFRRLAPGEAPPILRQVMVDPATVTVILPDADAPARVLAARLQDHAPRWLAADAVPSRAPMLVIGKESEVDRWLARNRYAARPVEVAGKGTAQVWTQTRASAAPLFVVSARDAEALAALARPLPHYGRQSYLAFDGARAIERGVWPAQPVEWRLP